MSIARRLIEHAIEAYMPPGFKTDIEQTAKLSKGVISNEGPDYFDVKFPNRTQAMRFTMDLDRADPPYPYTTTGTTVRVKVP